jgi:hypothetical protein
MPDCRIHYRALRCEQWSTTRALNNLLQCGPFDAIWYSDRLISTGVSDRLRAAVIELERVPDDMKDWHPGSNSQVLDLFHPSLYCIVYGRTCYADLTRLEPPEYEALQVTDHWVGRTGRCQYLTHFAGSLLIFLWTQSTAWSSWSRLISTISIRRSTKPFIPSSKLSYPHLSRCLNASSVRSTARRRTSTATFPRDPVA